MQPFPSLWKNEWIERIEKGVWIRPPGTQRKEDDLVLYWIHGEHSRDLSTLRRSTGLIERIRLTQVVHSR